MEKEKMKTRKIGINGYMISMNSIFANDICKIISLGLIELSNTVMVKLVDGNDSICDNTYLIKSRTPVSQVVKAIPQMDFKVVGNKDYLGCTDWISRRKRSEELLSDGNRDILFEVRGWKLDENRSKLVRV